MSRCCPDTVSRPPRNFPLGSPRAVASLSLVVIVTESFARLSAANPWKREYIVYTGTPLCLCMCVCVCVCVCLPGSAGD